MYKDTWVWMSGKTEVWTSTAYSSYTIQPWDNDIVTDEENEAKKGTSNLPKVIQRSSDTSQDSCL